MKGSAREKWVSAFPMSTSIYILVLLGKADKYLYICGCISKKVSERERDCVYVCVREKAYT